MAQRLEKEIGLRWSFLQDKTTEKRKYLKKLMFTYQELDSGHTFQKHA